MRLPILIAHVNWPTKRRHGNTKSVLIQAHKFHANIDFWNCAVWKDVRAHDSKILYFLFYF